MIIGFDVDLTVVRSDIPWINWMERVVADSEKAMLTMLPRVDQSLLLKYMMLDMGLKVEDLLPYDTAKLYPQFESLMTDPFDFWENNHLYDDMKPIDGCVEALRELKERGHTLRVVSKTMKGHYSSKVKFIKRWFPFIELNGKSGDAFVATHEKFAVQMDALVDDRMSNFKQLPDSTLKILFDTPYTQDYTCPVDLITCKWSKIKDFLISMED